MQAARRARWAELSERLDELLDLEPAARAARVEAVRAEDAALADELQALLDELPRIEEQGFLEQPALPPSMTPSLVGRAIGPWMLERELGEGGMGSVWLARRTDGRYDGCVAVKFLHGGITGAATAERFAHEGRILGKLQHPNIARLVDAGVLDGVRPFLMLEHVDGEPIDRFCDAAGLHVQDRVLLFLDVLAAVAHAHNRLILHRDLKPSNILVTRDGQVKLLDFGIAKLLDDEGAASDLTQRAGRAFTPQYAAPEQLQGDEVTTATDVYALGVLLYRLLSGVHPTADPTTVTPVDQMRAVIETEPTRLSEVVRQSRTPEARRRARALRGDLDNIVAKALRKAPAERYANAEALAEDLRRHLSHEPVLARPEGAAYRLAKFVRRYRAGVAAAGVTMLALSAGIGVALWQANAARQEHAKAEGLIEFMLGDLRKRLEPVGRLDVLDAVGEKALAHYDRQDLGRLSADALGRRARALHLIGEIAEQRGQLVEASAVFQRAADSTAALLARAPNDAQRVYDHAQSVFWVGQVARNRGENVQAAEAFRNYLDLARRLVALEPSKVDWQAELAMAGNNLAVVLLESGQPREALARFAEVRAAWGDVVRVRPALHSELAHTWGWIAKSHETLGEAASALSALDAKLQALKHVDESGGNREADLLRSTTHYDIARLALDGGDAPRAVRSASAGVQLLEGLIALDPSNLNWRQRLAFQRVTLTEALLADGRRPQAMAQWQRLRQDSDAVLKAADPGDLRRQLRLAGWRLVLQQRLEGTLPPAAVTDYFAGARPFAASGALKEPDNLRVLATVRLAAGDAAMHAGGAAHAQSHWREAAALLSPSSRIGTPALLALLAHARLRLGDREDAVALAARIPDTYRHPVMADLRERLGVATGAAPAANPM